MERTLITEIANFILGDNIEICREEQDKMKPGHGYSKSMQINSRNVQELGIKVKTVG